MTKQINVRMIMKIAATEAPIDTNKISPSISHAELKA